jgi:hypothetical protein
MTKFERMARPELFCDEELFWNDDAESVIGEAPKAMRIYDLEERTARFGASIIDFAKRMIPASSFLRTSLFGFRHSNHAYRL